MNLVFDSHRVIFLIFNFIYLFLDFTALSLKGSVMEMLAHVHVLVNVQFRSTAVIA